MALAPTDQLYRPADYPFAQGSGADKLADSGVAPLVAYVRGLCSITPANVESTVGAQRWRKNSAPCKQLMEAVGSADALWMPWFTADKVVTMQTSELPVTPAMVQVRPHPANVTYSHNNKPRKYINIVGSPTVIGVHPATPQTWLSKPHRALFAEGMLKADSALTGMLLGAGVDPAALHVTQADLADEPCASGALQRLIALLNTIDDADRMVVYGVVSVTTFSKNPEWTQIRLEGDCLIAFDGDIGSNSMVWSGGKTLFDIVARKGGTPKLIDLSAQVLPADEARAPEDRHKVGVDDYLAHIGTWDQLVQLTVDRLPPAPEDIAAAPGAWRMNNEKLVAEVYKPGADEFEPGTWLRKVGFVGRIAAIEDRRAMTEREMATGVLRTASNATDTVSFAEVEFSFHGDSGKPETHLVRGPADILAEVCSQWRRIPGTVVPSSLSSQVGWPPREWEFLDALKANRRSETIKRPLWSHMGWVAAPDATPVFVVGDQVIGPRGLAPELAASGVSNTELSVASKFGVQLPESREEARDVVRRVLDAFYPSDPNDAPFRDPRHSAILLAAALRPCVPRKCSVPIALMGTTGAGKTWALAATLAFWQSEPGTWTEKSLTGSANDTPAAAEAAISMAPIWVVDDIVASEGNVSGSNRQTDAVWDLVRLVFNGQPKQRRRPDMSAQVTYTPRALLMISAEKQPEDRQSIMNRTVQIKVAKRQFLSESRVPTHKIVAMAADDSPQSKVTGYLLSMLARRAEESSWDQLLFDVAEAYEHNLKLASGYMPDGASDSDRQAKTVADLALGMTMWSWLVDDLDLEEDYVERVANLSAELPRVARDGYESAQQIVLGHQFMERIITALRGGRCHVGALGSSGAPITAGPDGLHSEAKFLNQSLGWTLGEAGQPDRPNGPRIGDLVTDRMGNLAVVFNPQESYIISGYRTSSTSQVWESAVQNGWQLGQAEGGWAPKSTGGGAGWKQRVSRGRNSIEGVAVPLWKLTGRDGPEHPLDGSGS